MSVLHTISARLGSRFAIAWDPARHGIKHSAIGVPYARPAALRLGVEVDGHEACFPFCPEAPDFNSLEQELTPTSVRWRGYLAATGTLVDFTIVSPLAPRDELVSGLPAFFLTVKVAAVPDLLRQHGRLPGNPYAPAACRPRGTVCFNFTRAGLQPETAPAPDQVRWSYIENLHAIDPEWNNLPQPVPGPASAEVNEALQLFTPGARLQPEGFSWDFDLTAGRDTVELVWVAHTDGTFFESTDGPSRLRYTTHYRRIDDVLAVAASQRSTLLAAARAFDDVIAAAGLGHAYTEFFAIALAWYLANTWWLTDQAGEEWFTVTEGKCLFLSTVDVEYNIGPFYLRFWPHLLKLQLRRWTRYIAPESYLHHDVGRLPQAVTCGYPHPMACEENANFLLMALGHEAVTGDRAFTLELWPLLRRLGHYLLAADTTGNGMPNIGTANTIDDASDAVQFASENIYLSVKVYAAIRALRSWAERLGEAELAGRCASHESAFQKTFAARGWQGTHYATCLLSENTRTEIFEDDAAALVGAAEVGQAGRKHRVSGVEHWRAPSLYTTNGLLYLLIAGLDHGLDEARLRQDLQHSYEQSLFVYGCYHSAADRSNIWISQNIWRDAVAGYLGLDFSRNVERYLKFQQFANTDGLSRGFVDTYGWNDLHSYPRGIAIVAYLYAYARREPTLPSRGAPGATSS